MRGRPSWPFLAVLPLLVGMSASCGPATKIRPAPPEVSMRFDELAVLGGDLDGPAEELLGRPAAVRTDRAGNVYVADRGSMTVRVFDTQGRFLRAFGGRGRGRGEFLEITCLEVTSDGELIVADGLGLRLTRFAASGEVVATYPIDEQAMLWPRRLRQIGPDRYLFLYKLPAADGQGKRRPDAPFLFHLYDGTFSTKLATFGRFTKILRQRGVVPDHLTQIDPGSMWPEGDGSVLYAPGLYRGELYRYANQGGTWKRTETLYGFVTQPEPFTVVDDPDRFERDEIGFTLHSRGGRYAGFFQNQSRGVFRMRDGRIVHFTLITEGEGRTFGAELFSSDGVLEGYAPLHRAGAQPATVPVHVVWKDEEDRFYLREIRPDEARVRIVRLVRDVAGTPPQEPASGEAVR